MDYIDYGGAVGNGQGPFVDFLYPKGTYAPDSSGIVTVPSMDVKAVLDWAVANLPSHYTSSLYLTSLSLAVESGPFNGTIKTSYASFAIQANGSSVVYTPPFTSNHWTTCSTTSDCDDGNPCTTDSCVSGSCSHMQIPGCGDAGGMSGSDGGSGSKGDGGGSGSSGGSGSGGGSGSSSGSGLHHDGGFVAPDAGRSGSGAGTGTSGADGGPDDGFPGSDSGGSCNLSPARGDGASASWIGVGLAAFACARARRRLARPGSSFSIGSSAHACGTQSVLHRPTCPVQPIPPIPTNAAPPSAASSPRRGSVARTSAPSLSAGTIAIHPCGPRPARTA
jgi:hypothetical protein